MAAWMAPMMLCLSSGQDPLGELTARPEAQTEMKMQNEMQVGMLEGFAKIFVSSLEQIASSSFSYAQ